MKNNDLVFKINTNNKGVQTASISISTLLNNEDYDDVWAGENGSDGYETENILNIRLVLENYIQDGEWLDLQILEKGNAWANGLNPNKLEELVKAIELFDNDTYELVESI